MKGRCVGVLILLHLAVGLIVPFVLLDRVRGASSLFETAAAHPDLLRAAVLLLFAGGAIALGISVATWEELRRAGSAALWLPSVAVAALSLQAVDNVALLALLSLSEARAAGEAGSAIGLAVGAARGQAHFVSLLFQGTWIFVFCALLYRARLVPRALAAVVALASVLQLAGVPLRALLGYPPEVRLAMPLAPAYVALAAWLIAKGYRREETRVPAAVRGAF